MTTKTLIKMLLLFLMPLHLFANNDLQKLAKEFFEWRTVTQPATSDDINRVERPLGWVPDFSADKIEENRQQYMDFKKELLNIPRINFTVSDSIDFLLMNSAIERVNWELNVLHSHSRNPDFYVHQTLGALYELLIISSPMTNDRAKEIIVRLNSFSKTIEDAKSNLTEPVAVFAEIALENCQNPTDRLQTCATALKAMFPVELHLNLDSAVKKASIALEEYIDWIDDSKHVMSNDFSVGRKEYEYFLREIALMPYTPEDILEMGKQAWNRSVAFDIFEIQRNVDLPKAEIFKTVDEQIKQQQIHEIEIRKFLEEKDIMTVPDWLMHYKNIAIPDHIAPFKNMGVVDDLTSPNRLNEDAVAYIPNPSKNLPYFWRACAQDPRPIIIHEGIPGHYFHLANSWVHPNPIRRHFFDSGSMEGIGFYVEELLLQFGLFDNSPRTREIIYSFMRLRALRVDVDVNLALGNYTIEQAGEYLASTIPMDRETAIAEAGFFALTPGQAISYQIGKLQILDYIADAKIIKGDKFNLRNFHDYLIKNGNVPIALQRWEYLGLTDEIEKLWPIVN